MYKNLLCLFLIVYIICDLLCKRYFVCKIYILSGTNKDVSSMITSAAGPGRIVGGVVGAVLILILVVAVLVVAAGLVWRHRIKRQKKTNYLSEGIGLHHNIIMLNSYICAPVHP